MHHLKLKRNFELTQYILSTCYPRTRDTERWLQLHYSHTDNSHIPYDQDSDNMPGLTGISEKCLEYYSVINYSVSTTSV